MDPQIEEIELPEDKVSEIPRVTIRFKITTVLYYKFCSVLVLAIMDLIFKKWVPGSLLLANGIAGLGATLSKSSKIVYYDIFFFILIQLVHIGLIISDLVNLNTIVGQSAYGTEFNLSVSKLRDAYLAVDIIDLLMNLSLLCFISWSLYEYRRWLISHNK